MKKLLCILLIALLLSACGAESVETTQVSTEETTEPAPVGLYDPDSQLEKMTDGAIRVYPLDANDYKEVVVMGNRLLLSAGLDRLQVLQGQLCEPVSTMVKGPDSLLGSMVDMGAQGVVYYSEADRSVILLNPQLQETERIALPEEMLSTPVVSMTKQEIFYCVPGELRALHMQTGISRLIKTHSYETMTLCDDYFDGEMLHTQVTDASGEMENLYLSTQTGQTLSKSDTLYQLESEGSYFLGRRTDGYVDQVIYGERTGSVGELVCPEGTNLIGALAQNRVLTYEDTALGMWLYLHDLTNGATVAGVQLKGVAEPISVAADQNYIWILIRQKKTEQQMLLRWDPSMTPAEGTALSVHPLYTAENPDEATIEQLQSQAQTMKDAYGAQVRIWQQALEETNGLSVTAEHNTQIIEDKLTELESVLQRFPKGFLYETVDGGLIRICLVRSMDNGETWTQFWKDSDCYILISIDADLEEAALRGIGLAIDAHVLGHSRDYDFWENRSPEGFAYTLSNDAIPEELQQYLEGETKAFVDPAGMCFPNVDRAYIWAEAMKADNAELFAAPFLQQKILRICEGIREAYNVEKVSDAYPWEQYLTEEMNFSNFNRD